jgi:hypothetical protein
METPKPNPDVYMSADQYNRFVLKAHNSYMSARLYPAGKTSHVVDLATESAGFFEALFHIMDAYTDEIRPHVVFTLNKENEYFEELLEDLDSLKKNKKKGKRRK